MSEKLPIVIVESDAGVRAVLERALHSQLDDSHGFVVCAPEDVDADVPAARCIALGAAAAVLGARAGVHMATPVRVGAVFDRLLRLEKSALGTGDEVLHFAGWALEPAHSVLRKDVEGARDVRLTEKEAAILKILYQHTDRSVSREELLDQVWGYADGVETHTLETHIYRLRQKLEEDPAAPQVLLTTDSGYCLAQVLD